MSDIDKMVVATPHTVPLQLLDFDELYLDDNRFYLNEPTGNFFYDPWKLKPEIEGTVWDSILKTLPFQVGEARVIRLKSGNCYFQHADIDDRYHLNLSGDSSFLVDLDNDIMYRTEKNGVWYYMNAGKLHSAVNVGEKDRYQLVVRKLLNRAILKNPVHLTINARGTNPRFRFDNTISPILNRLNKENSMNDFNIGEDWASFDIEKSRVDYLLSSIPNHFEVKYHHEHR